MLKPVCSNCILYNTDCRTSIIRRKANPARVRAAKPQQQEESSRTEALESRLARIEAQLQLVLNTARDAQPQQSPDSHSSEGTEGVSSAENEVYPGIARSSNRSWKFDPINPSIYEGPEPDSMLLPPLDEVLPIVDHYFSTFNTVIPLFHQPVFMKMLHTWYNQPPSRDRATWAAIQIVMALGYRTPQLALADTQMVHVERADQCLRNAQTVVSELVTRDQDLLGVQILLGIVMLFQNSRDPKPASVIIGTAVRLAHRLQLHSSNAGDLFPVVEAEQRSRVFWIAYTLDKDICLRANTPSCQFDDDVDIPLPTLAPADSAGLIWTQNGQVHFNYHRRRVELAYIQGKVYDLLYSNRASKVHGAERKRRVLRLQTMLDQWYERIPTVFHIDHVAATVGPSQLVQMTKMHHSFLLAEVMTHGIYSHNADWVKRISSFSRAAIGDLDEGFGTASKCNLRDQEPPLPEGWTKCVDVSRGCMQLFQGATPTECLVWQCSCSHFSALIILLANMILNPGHKGIHVDQHLAVKALDLFDKLLGVIDDAAFRSLRTIVGELSHKAEAAVANYRRELSRTGQDIFEVLNVDPGADAQPELDFLPVNNVFDGLDGPFSSLDTEVDFDSLHFDPSGGGDMEGLDTGVADLIGFMR
ncbi:hypothetical protein ACHAPT_009357 [Fusarium lateritium]